MRAGCAKSLGTPWTSGTSREGLQKGPEGLDDKEAAHRLGFYGPNALPVRKPPTLPAILRVEPVRPSEWLIALSMALTLLVVMELFKRVTKRDAELH
jgi:hypothetical protein